MFLREFKTLAELLEGSAEIAQVAVGAPQLIVQLEQLLDGGILRTLERNKRSGQRLNGLGRALPLWVLVQICDGTDSFQSCDGRLTESQRLRSTNTTGVCVSLDFRVMSVESTPVAGSVCPGCVMI